MSAPEPPEPVFIGTDGSGSLDDAIGAAMSARSIMEGIAASRGGEVHIPDRPVHFDGMLAVWRDDLSARIMDGRTRLCRHLEANTAQVMIWFVYMPDLIHCARCGERAASSVYGTPADDICDGCGKTVDGPHMHTVTGEVTAQIRKGQTTGPVLIHGGLCAECNEKDAATRRSYGERVRRVERRED